MPNSSAVMRRHNLDIIYETEHLASKIAIQRFNTYSLVGLLYTD